MVMPKTVNDINFNLDVYAVEHVRNKHST
jgi:hypothetical protein